MTEISPRRERTLQRILDGAAAAFSKGGYAGTSMEDIAAAAGVSKLLLYRDFAGKRELYQAVLDRTIRRLDTLVPQQASNEALRALIAAARADQDGFILLHRHAAHEPEFAPLVARLQDASALEAERQLAPIEPDPVLRRWAAHTVLATTVVAIVNWLEYGDPDRDDEFFARLLDVNRAVAKPIGSRLTSSTATGTGTAQPTKTAPPETAPTKTAPTKSARPTKTAKTTKASRATGDRHD
jgi:AcrR family transcriptional regulator